MPTFDAPDRTRSTATSTTQTLGKVMQAELLEQPTAMQRLLAIRLYQQEQQTNHDANHDAFAPHCEPIRMDPQLVRCLADARQVLLTGCGSSLHAAWLTRDALCTLAGLPGLLVPAHELVAVSPNIWRGPELGFIFSQSGETADTCEAQRLAQEFFCPLVALTSDSSSTLAQKCRWHIDTEAGSERAIPSTKGFVAQAMCGLLLAAAAGLARRSRSGPQAGQTPKHISDVVDACLRLPQLAQTLLAELLPQGQQAEQVQEAAQRLGHSRQAIYLGRGPAAAAAAEGALKLKESAYLLAHSSYVGEFKHGPMAMLERGDVVVGLLEPQTSQAQLNARTPRALIELAKAGAYVVVIAQRDDSRLNELLAAEQINVLYTQPGLPQLVWPVAAALVLQVVALTTARTLGIDPDAPRRLVKSIQVH